MRRTATRLLHPVGVSGMAVYAPPCKVELKEWCDWTGNSWSKVSSVVGSSFRVPSHNENAYTMAATAVLRLIMQYDIDPQRIGQLNLGTESSTDNSAGAIIVRGMVDNALRSMGLPAISRHCEVPEMKHACLGGVYAMKSSARYCLTDGRGRCSIAVASDIAEYERGSTGEQTQGAGAVAMLIEENPRLFEMEITHSGSGSSYRGPDFRKPVKRHFTEGYGTRPAAGEKIPDFPVFSGPYSTVCYLEEVATAVENMLENLNERPSEFYNSVTALFFHRPYNMMPIQAMSFLYARALARSTSHENRERFSKLCAQSKVQEVDVRAELKDSTDLFALLEKTNKVPDYAKNTNAIAKALRAEPAFMELLNSKMTLGSATMAQFGNLYTAALPCWLAAGFEEAVQKGLTNLTGKPMVMVGYGSGDAAEAIPIRPRVGWEAQARRLHVREALDSNAVLLTKDQYEALHSGALKTDIAAQGRKQQFVIDRTGTRNEPAFQDVAVDYFKYIQ